MGKKVRIQLAPGGRDRLEALIANGNTPQKLVRRARRAVVERPDEHGYQREIGNAGLNPGVQVLRLHPGRDECQSQDGPARDRDNLPCTHACPPGFTGKADFGTARGA